MICLSLERIYIGLLSKAKVRKYLCFFCSLIILLIHTLKSTNNSANKTGLDCACQLGHWKDNKAKLYSVLCDSNKIFWHYKVTQFKFVLQPYFRSKHLQYLLCQYKSILSYAFIGTCCLGNCFDGDEINKKASSRSKSKKTIRIQSNDHWEWYISKNESLRITQTLKDQ